MLTWPHADTDWAPLLTEAEGVYRALAREITRREALLVVCRDSTHRDHISAQIAAEPGARPERVIYAQAPANDTWARDHGPITVFDADRPRLLDFGFNGWGGKFDAQLDDAINRTIALQGVFGDTPLEPVPMILEGGGIESDGTGTLLTTRQCLLTPTRNPGLSEADIEARLRALFGVERILWLSNGHLAGDDTDAHVDTLARFCDPQTIAYASCEDPSDEHHAPLAAMARELERLRDRAGNPYRLIPLPLPAPAYDQGRRLPATYANFLIMNEAVLVPTYADPADAIALERLRSAFPGREVLGIDCRALIRQNGSLHCVTMQFPEGVLSQPGAP